LLSLAALLTAASTTLNASSHREAPAITGTPKLDCTDFYMFRSYETGRENFVTIIANYVPLQDAYGGPNYFALDPDALYRIHVDNTGDGGEDITFHIRVHQTLRDIKVPVGSKMVSIPLLNAGQITGPGQAVQNVEESFTLAVVRGALDSPSPTVHYATNAASGLRP